MAGLARRRGGCDLAKDVPRTTGPAHFDLDWSSQGRIEFSELMLEHTRRARDSLQLLKRGPGKMHPKFKFSAPVLLRAHRARSAPRLAAERTISLGSFLTACQWAWLERE